MSNKNIAIIGAGISGCSLLYQLYLNKNYTLHLFDEKKQLFSSNMPWYHLHAGGVLYPFISKDEARLILLQALQFCEAFESYIIKIPTIVAYVNHDLYSYDPYQLLDKCKAIQDLYIEYCATNPPYLLDPSIFYAAYNQEDCEKLLYPDANFQANITPDKKFHNRYMKKFYQSLKNKNSIIYPIVSVNEFKINFTKIISIIRAIVKNNSNIIFNHKRVDRIRYNGKKLSINNSEFIFDNVLLALGYKTHDIKISMDKEDEIIDINSHFLEYKRSFLIKNKSDQIDDDYPEIAIIGTRKTQYGLLEVNPFKCHGYKNQLFHIHYMSNESSTYDFGIFDFNKDKNVGDFYEKVSYSDVQNPQRAAVALARTQSFLSGFEHAKIIEEFPGGIQRIAHEDNEKRTLSIKLIDQIPEIIDVQITKGMCGIYAANQIIKSCGFLNPKLLYTKQDTPINKLIIVARHGPRYPIKKTQHLPKEIIFNHIDPELTKLGIEYCQQFGAFLRKVYEKRFTFNFDSTLMVASCTKRTISSVCNIAEGLFGKKINGKLLIEKFNYPKDLTEEELKYFNFRKGRVNTTSYLKEKIERLFLFPNDFIRSTDDYFQVFQTINYLDRENLLTNLNEWTEIDYFRLKFIVELYFKKLFDDKLIDIFTKKTRLLIADFAESGKSNLCLISSHDWVIHALIKYFKHDLEEVPDFCGNIRIEIGNRYFNVYYNDIILISAHINELHTLLLEGHKCKHGLVA